MMATWKKIAFENDVLLKSVYDSGSVVVATSDNTPIMADIAASQILGRAGGAIDGLTATEVRTICNVADGATANAFGTSSTVNTGTDDALMINAASIAGSTNVPHVVPSTSGKFMVSDGSNWISSAQAPSSHAFSAHSAATGAILLGGYQLQNFVLHTVADNAAKSALSPTVGMIVFQTDVAFAYGCVAI
jgi:hypothetical protein